ncbi:MAG: baseplate J/gp47 family protein [Anaerolineaceae bacterium]|nr:baseplate J/gp47 family protein [Anaerolineaceae bacterium]
MSDYPFTIVNYRNDPYLEELVQKIVASEYEHILLVIPAQPKGNLDLLQLRLLKRLAVTHHRTLSIATRNNRTIELAKSAHIQVFRSVGSAKRNRWGKHVSDNDFLAHKSSYPPPHLPHQNRWFFPTIRNHPWWEWLAVILAIILLFFLPIFLLTSAQIEIQLEPISHSMTLLLNGSTTVFSADLSGNFPVHEEYQILEIERQADSTGILSLPEEFATGMIEVTNLSDKEFDIPRGLIVMTLDSPPVQFETTEDFQLDPDSENMIIQIIALNPGKIGNVPAETIQAVAGDSGAFLRIINPKATIGGANRRVSTPTESDLSQLRTQLLQELETDALQSFTLYPNDSQTLVPNSIIIEEIIKEEAVPTPGETADTFNLSLRVRFRAWVVDTDDLLITAAQLLTASLPANQSLLTDTVEIYPISAPVLTADGADWEVLIHQKSQPVLTSEMLKMFAGGTKPKLIDWLEEEYNPTSPITIHTKPINGFWLPPIFERMELIVSP